MDAAAFHVCGSSPVYKLGITTTHHIPTSQVRSLRWVHGDGSMGEVLATQA